MAQVNVTIVGLGRLGASFGLALRALTQRAETKHSFTVVGYDQAGAAMRTALKLGAIDREVPELDLAVAGADLVFLAVPYDTTRDVMEIIGPALKPGAVVMDTSPLKLPSIAWAKDYFRRDEDGHPIAYLVGVTLTLNPEHLGDPSEDTESARADLFLGGLMILSPAVDCPAEAVQLVSDLSKLMAIKVHFVDPAEHDGIVAATEGLPLLMQFGLFQSLTRSPSWSDTQWMGNPAFFLATYRLAESDPTAMAQLIHLNRQNILHRLDALVEALGTLREALTIGDEALLAETLDDAMIKYARWQQSRLRNQWDTEPEPQQEIRSSLSIAGGLGGLLPSFAGRKKKKAR